MIRAAAVLTVAVVSWAASPAPPGASPEAPSVADAAQGGAARIREASRRGIVWLTEQAHGSAVVSSSFAARAILERNLRMLYRVEADEDLVRSLRLALEALEKAHPVRLPARAELAARTFGWAQAEPVVNELLRQRCSADGVDAAMLGWLRAMVEQREEQLLGSLKPGPAVVAAWKLEQLGLRPSPALGGLVEELRRQAAETPGEALDLDLLYGLTHVVFVRSDYFGHRLEPGEFRVELEEFRRALAVLAARERLQGPDLDVAAEILVSLRVLDRPWGESARAVAEKILAEQHADGSWGGGARSLLLGRLHNTAVATLASASWADAFRPPSVFCDLTPLRKRPDAWTSSPGGEDGPARKDDLPFGVRGRGAG